MALPNIIQASPRIYEVSETALLVSYAPCPAVTPPNQGWKTRVFVFKKEVKAVVPRPRQVCSCKLDGEEKNYGETDGKKQGFFI